LFVHENLSYGSTQIAFEALKLIQQSENSSVFLKWICWN